MPIQVILIYRRLGAYQSELGSIKNDALIKMNDLSNEELLSVQDNLLVDSERNKKYESLLLNCICVGQWEIARALIRTLFEEKAAKNYTGELLKVLILEANEFW